MLRVLTIVVVVLAALYGGYWVVGSSRVEREVRAALDGLAARGWDVRFDEAEVDGFPSRFDLNLSGLALTSPDGRLLYASERLSVMALSYRPNEVIAAWPDGLGLLWSDLRVTQAEGGPLRIERVADAPTLEELQVDPEDWHLGHLHLVVPGPLRASARAGWGEGRVLSLRALTVEGGHEAQALILQNWPTYILQARHFVAALRHAGGAPASYDVALDLEGFDLDASGEGDLSIEGGVTLDRPLDSTLDGPPRVESLGVTSALLTMGEASLRAAGNLGRGADGALNGRFDLTATGWAALLDAAREAELIDEGLAIFYGRLLDQASAGAESVDIPVVLEGGRVSVLGLPVGVIAPPAP